MVNNKDRLYKLLPFAVFFLLTGFYCISTHFHPLTSGSAGYDSGIFAYVGMAMKEGRVLYTEVCENKGPLLYFINFLGVSLNHNYGILVFEFISIFSTLVFLYKAVRLYYGTLISLVSSCVSSWFLTVSLSGGNLCEEYALPFMSWCLFLTAKFIKQDCCLKKLELFAVGITIGAVLLLRINILAFQFCLVLAAIILLIKSKDFKKLLEIFTFGLLGFAAFLFPFLIYLIKNGALAACLDLAYFGTVSSFVNIGLFQRFTNVVIMIVKSVPCGTFFIVFVYVFLFPLFKDKKQKNILPLQYTCYVALFLNLIANAISGTAYMHYFINFIPIVLFPIAWMLNLLKSKLFENKELSKRSALAIMTVFIIGICGGSLPEYCFNTVANLGDISTPKSRIIESYVLENSKPNETVQAFGRNIAVGLNYRTKRLSASKYSYYGNGIYNAAAMKKFANSIAEDIYKNKPQLIVYEFESRYDLFVGYLDDSARWEEMLSEYYIKVDEDFMGGIIYKLKGLRIF